MEEGFSAIANAVSVSANAQISSWSIASPYFNSGNFNPATGVYTVPATGRYAISATISYETLVALTIGINAATPAFVVRRTTPTTDDLIFGLFPVLNLSLDLLGIGLINVRGILGNGTVTLSGVVELDQNDEIGLFYVADGLTVNIDLGGPSTPIHWSIYQITE
ncbi:hypothetical protein MKZ01_12875 [Lysinibacillus endophyticus]